MSHHITQEARKYLQRSKLPKFVLDQITELCNKVEQLEQENQYLRMRDQGEGFKRRGEQDQSQPMGFIYPFRYRPWYSPFFRSGEQEYTREYRGEDYDVQGRQGYDSPRQNYRPYPNEMRFRESPNRYDSPNYRYNPTREDSEPYNRETPENPRVTNLEPVR